MAVSEEGRVASGEEAAERFPTGPLVATLAIQTLSTMAAYSLPAVAPAVAADLGVPGPLIGFFVSTVYSVGIVSALLSPGFIHRFGAVRVSQVIGVATLAMIAATVSGGVGSVALGAALLGLAYGATAPAATHLLVPRTPQPMLNLVLSIRQIGVPLGGVLAGLLMPPLTLLYGWRWALLSQAGLSLALVVALQVPRGRWDAGRDPARSPFAGGGLASLRLLRESAALRRLSAMSFVYSGLQLCFVAFMTVHLTSVAGFSLVAAGQALAAYQIAGVASRPVWGLLADRLIGAHWLLALQGAIMCGASILAGRFAADWPGALVLVVCAVAGATSSGFTGIAYGEYARLGGARRTEAAGLGAASMFSGVMVLPSVMAILVTTTGGYEWPYALTGMLALAVALPLIGRGYGDAAAPDRGRDGGGR